jgi:hypothetical protein
MLDHLHDSGCIIAFQPFVAIGQRPVHKRDARTLLLRQTIQVQPFAGQFQSARGNQRITIQPRRFSSLERLTILYAE